jgi:NADH:ubiquinone oxidoreductase subunit B-like Fe-S oxidoreductase
MPRGQVQNRPENKDNLDSRHREEEMVKGNDITNNRKDHHDKFMPVDLHVPGCPPRPESLVYGILKLRAMVLAKPVRHNQQRSLLLKQSSRRAALRGV